MNDAMPFREIYFPALVDAIGWQRCLDVLGVHPTTLRRWYTGRVRVPLMARAALWPLTHWARSAEVTDLQNQLQILQQLADLRELEIRQLEARIRHLVTLVDWGCANDPLPARQMA